MNTTLLDRTSRRDSRVASMDQRAYPLGYSEGEFKRLEQQSALYVDVTEDMLRRAGVTPGMRVLDIGCGVGDVSQLAAWLVGPSGSVLGIDRSQEAVGVATWRAAAAGQDWVRFAAAELDAFSTQETFDALIGRLVLMYLPDPAATLRRLCRHVRTGGVVAFLELVMPLARSVPEGPQCRKCIGWITDTLARVGFEYDMGSRLYATFLAAGLPVPQMVVAGRAEGGPQSPVYDYLANTVRSLLPTIERMGVATAAEVDVDTLAERLRAEAVENRACVMPPPFVGAWTCLPA